MYLEVHHLQPVLIVCLERGLQQGLEVAQFALQEQLILILQVVWQVPVKLVLLELGLMLGLVLVLNVLQELLTLTREVHLLLLVLPASQELIL